MEDCGSNRGRFTLITSLLLAIVTCVHGYGSVRSFTFHLMNTTNSINATNVNRIFGRTDSVQHCGMRCANLMSPSFYHADTTATCYCNSHYDPDIVEDTGPGDITYGYVDVEELTRPGTLAECQDVYDQGYQGDVVFQLSAEEAIMCNLTSLGWVVFQRRLNGGEDFYRTWTEYVNGFGDQDGEFWLGLETIHQMTQVGCELHIYLEAAPGETVQDKGFARYSGFAVASALSNYTLSVSGFSGNVGDSFVRHNGKPFSTHDADNDLAPGNCAFNSKGGWWYDFCHASNLNGLYLAGNQTSYADGINWNLPWGYYYSLFRTEMAFRC